MKKIIVSMMLVASVAFSGVVMAQEADKKCDKAKTENCEKKKCDKDKKACDKQEKKGCCKSAEKK